MRYFSLLFSAASVATVASCSKPQLPDPQPVEPVAVVTPSASVTTPTPAATPAPLIGSLHPMAYANLIVGQVEYTSPLKPEALSANRLSVNVGGLVNAGEPLRMIALGGSLAAGVRNGGLYREGQLTAYPNLVARQMGLTDFESPLFGLNEANGTGFMLYADPTARYPTWKQVTNNLAPVQAGDPPVLSTYAGSNLSNFAAPTMSGYYMNTKWSGLGVNQTGRSWYPYQPYLWRYFPTQRNRQIGLIDYIQESQSYNFFLYEEDFDALLYLIRDNRQATQGWSYNITSFPWPQKIPRTVEKLQATTKSKGVIFTVPNFRDLAFMNWYTVEDLKSKAASIDITYTCAGYPNPRPVDLSKEFFLMPTPTIAAFYKNLAKGDAVRLALSDADLMDWAEAEGATPTRYNELVRGWAKQYNLALVDLELLYSQIHRGRYTTSDGLQIDGSPKGNFFSSDGISPTALGQAVIANEVIKAINNTYQTSIPSLGIRSYIQTVGLQ